MDLFHAWNLGARANVWFDYVPTKANPADYPSRTDLSGRAWRVVGKIRSSPVECLLPYPTDWSDPGGWLAEAAAIAAQSKL